MGLLPSSPTSRWFEEGVDARARGRLPADNPYCIRTDEHHEWLAGWNAICDLDEDSDPQSLRTTGAIRSPRD